MMALLRGFSALASPALHSPPAPTAPTPAVTGASGPATCSSSAPRVLVLVAVIVALSIVDLCFTINWATSVGMVESNPLARSLMRSADCPWVLALWKVLTAGLGVGIFIATRRRWQAEVGAWLCALVMVWLTVRWLQYNAYMTDLTSALDTLQGAFPDKYVLMTP